MIYRCSGTIHKDDKAGETILAGDNLSRQTVFKINYINHANITVYKITDKNKMKRLILNDLTYQ